MSSHLLASPLTASVKLLVKFPPRVVVVADRKVLSAGQTFRAHCEATAFPSSVEFSWYLDQHLLAGEREQEITIPSVQQEHDKKVVECRARNTEGTGAGSVAIHIKCGLDQVSLSPDSPSLFLLPRWPRVDDPAEQSDGARGNLSQAELWRGGEPGTQVQVVQAGRGGEGGGGGGP